MIYIRTLTDGKPQVIKDQAFCSLLGNILPAEDKSFDELFSEMDAEVYSNADVTKQAMSNVHGDWYEWLLAISAWNFCANNPSANVPLLMPNISQFDVASLYVERLFHLIQDLRNKVEDSSEVKLITSNPDFVIINRDVINTEIGEITLIDNLTPEIISELSGKFRQFENKCDFSQIEGYIAVKKSLRPDRRLQIPHEGSLMKAIYKHLQTREWIIDPKGLKYYAMASSVSDADKNALKTVATHSITTVSSLPQAAVDDVFQIDSIQQAQEIFQRIL